MKHVSIYERNGEFYIQADSTTTVGLWVADGDCYTISVDSDYDEIGKYLFVALNNSRADIPHPTELKEWNNLTVPLLKAAKVKSWSTFSKGTKLIQVNMDNDIRISPTENKCSVKQGFVTKENNIITIPIEVSHAELGKNVKEVWLFCGVV